MGIVKVNRTGQTANVYLSNACNSNEIIGTIYNNEVFTWREEWSGSGASEYSVQLITFRNSAGQKASGWIAGAQSEPIFQTNLSALRAKTVTLNGETYYAFKMRRDEELFDNQGNQLQNKKAYKDRYILTKGSTSGASNPHLLSVWYLETGVGTGVYSPIVSGTNAFVDLGYDKGSTMGSNFSLIGSIG
mgnify:CR=1 FL=1